MWDRDARVSSKAFIGPSASFPCDCFARGHKLENAREQRLLSQQTRTPMTTRTTPGGSGLGGWGEALLEEREVAVVMVILPGGS